MNVQQLTKSLVSRPDLWLLQGATLRNYSGPEDAEIWLQLRRSAFARQRLGIGDWDQADFEREFLSKLWWNPSNMWFAEDSTGDALGTICLARRQGLAGNRPAIHWLAVLPGARRRGVGRLLVSALEAAVWDAGERQIWLETHAMWREASEFYRALGYRAADQ
ncbi:MAG TPA: GNAT family N-acetyltransferase [Pirellulales bacterium]|jgi:GNAT superfamily N-acetyltransferase